MKVDTFRSDFARRDGMIIQGRMAVSIWWAKSAQRYQLLVAISQAWYPLGKAYISLYAELRPNCTQHHLLVKPWQ